MNIKLEQLADIEKNVKLKDDWSKAKLDTKSSVKFNTLNDKMQEDRDKLHFKKLNSKFINAKKKYAKRIMGDKKIEFENIDELKHEPYILLSNPTY